MQPCLSYALPLPSPPRFSGHLRKLKRSVPSRAMKLPMMKISASSQDSFSNHHYNGEMVDKNMIVLRKRIREKMMLEKSDGLPSHWMQWERQYYANYTSDVLQMVGFLQSKLMETRPGLALGTLILVLLSVPATTAMVVLYFVGLIKDI